MDIYSAVVVLHIAAGSIALITYWIAASARKGSPLHRGSGKVYLGAMLAVLATALVMAAWFFARGQFVGAIFLSYLSVITGTACWGGWRAIQLKQQPLRYFNRSFRVVAAVNLVLGLAVFGAGVWAGSWLLMLFCWIGVVLGITGLRQRLPDLKTDRRWWMREHYGAMIGNGVATHIAFLNLGLSRLLEPFGLQLPQLVGWLAPVAAALLASAWLDRKYFPKRDAALAGAASGD